jgi:hypothetical protein
MNLPPLQTELPLEKQLMMVKLKRDLEVSNLPSEVQDIIYSLTEYNEMLKLNIAQLTKTIISTDFP